MLIPPPLLSAWLPAIVLLTTYRLPVLAIPPPSFAELDVTVLAVMVTMPSLKC